MCLTEKHLLCASVRIYKPPFEEQLGKVGIKLQEGK